MKIAPKIASKEAKLIALILLDRAHFYRNCGAYCVTCGQPLSKERQEASICECSECLQIQEAA